MNVLINAAQQTKDRLRVALSRAMNQPETEIVIVTFGCSSISGLVCTIVEFQWLSFYALLIHDIYIHTRLWQG